ncbi:MAG: lamin tail domain-containing protein, partial [Verrucomicrobiales bacterium]|nr:lamin tail domain-containing protein [Verrucomicrobiales bacterium]
MSRRARFLGSHPGVLFLAFVVACLTPLVGRAELVISEFLAANGGSLLDEDGEASDWIELHNSATVPASTAGWSLTDDPNLPRKWVLPERTLAPGGFLVVFASGKNRTPAAPGPLHTNFRLEASGEYLALVGPDGKTVSTEFAPTFPPQDGDISYGRPASVGVRSLLEGARAVALVPSSATDVPVDWTTGGSAAAAPWVSTLGFPMGFDTTPATVGAATNLALAGTATQSTTGYGLGASNANDGDLNTFSHTATN